MPEIPQQLAAWWEAVRFDPLLILAILGVNVVVAELLCRKTPLRHFGTAMTVLVTTAITANLGIIPTSPSQAPVYGGITNYAIDLCIFWILLTVNLQDIRRAGGSMIFMFFVGALGTCVGVVTAMWFVGGSSESVFGSMAEGIGGTFVGTYIGGSQNFAAIAKVYDLHLPEHAGIYAGMVSVDSFYTLVWMVVTFLVPRVVLKSKSTAGSEAQARELITGIEEDTESVHPLDLGMLMAFGFAIVWVSPLIANGISGWGIEIPSILVLTTISLAIAQIPGIRKHFAGAQLLGMFILYLFLAVIGAQCDAAAVAQIGDLAWTLVVFVAVILSVHGVILFGTAWLFRIDSEVAAVASQANIGGATTALALARGLGRADLTLPGILVGTLGYGVGNYLAVIVARFFL